MDIITSAHFTVFYSQVFKELDIPLRLNLALFLKRRHHIKLWKKGYDENPENKKRRRWKYEAKDREELLKLASQGPKAGTYKTGVAMQDKEGCKVETPRKRKKRNPCSCGAKKITLIGIASFVCSQRMKKLMGGSQTTRKVRLALNLHSKTSFYSINVPVELLILHLSALCEEILDITDVIYLLPINSNTYDCVKHSMLRCNIKNHKC